MRFHCSGNCKHVSFPIKPLYNQKVSKFWSKANNRLVIEKRPISRTIKYTTKHKARKLARCKVCQYITAEPTKPGVRCPCCHCQLSRHVRDIKAKERTDIVRNE